MGNRDFADLLKEIKEKSNLSWESLAKIIQDTVVKNGRGMQVSTDLLKQYAHTDGKSIGQLRIYQIASILEEAGLDKEIADRMKSISLYSYLEIFNMSYSTYKEKIKKTDENRIKQLKLQASAIKNIRESINILLDNGWLPHEIHGEIAQMLFNRNLMHYMAGTEPISTTEEYVEDYDLPIFGLEEDEGIT